MSLPTLFTVEPKPNATRFELAVYAARLFEATGVVEEVIVNKFVDKFCYAGADNPSFFPNTSSNSRKRNRDQMSREPAYPGEQVRNRMFTLFMYVFTDVVLSVTGCC